MQFIIIIIIYFKAQTLLPQTFGSGSVPAGNTCLLGCLEPTPSIGLWASHLACTIWTYVVLIYCALFGRSEWMGNWFSWCGVVGWSFDFFEFMCICCSLWLIVSSGWLMWFCVLWVIIFLSMKCIGWNYFGICNTSTVCFLKAFFKRHRP